MARYIDADELYKATQKRIAEANEARMAVVDDEFLDLIDDAFTEDVAPRAEVAEEIFAEIYSYLTPYPNRCALISLDALAELKKKYTEAETEPPKGV